MAIYDGRIDDLLSSTAPDTTEQARELLLSLPVSEQGYYLEMNAAHAVEWRSLCAWAQEHVGQHVEMGAPWCQALRQCLQEWVQEKEAAQLREVASA